MCDKCGEIFSENADNWDTYSVNKRIRDEKTGEVRVKIETRDACPMCSLPEAPPAPRVALNAGTAVYGAGPTMSHVDSERNDK